MTSTIRMILILIAAITIVIITCYVIYLRDQIQTWSLRYEALQTQLQALQDQSARDKQRYTTAQQLAEANAEKWQQKANGILKDKVPTDCNKAIDWAVQQARKNGL